MQRGFSTIFILVGFLIIAGLAGGAYFFGKSQTNALDKQNPIVYSSPEPSDNKSVPDTKPTEVDETANWKEATFKKLTLKVPNNFKSSYWQDDMFVMDAKAIPDIGRVGSFVTGFSVSVFKNMTLDQAKQAFLTKDRVITDKMVTDITVDNKTAIKTTSTLSQGQDVEHHYIDAYISVGPDLYFFHSMDWNTSYADQQKYFDLILATFKFAE